ncbi:hypothetical protein TOL5_09460 [Acinetobacter sp. Tol 5]|nr:hypothetical protein TOL5_09460 [Acinetobacter sp. Tol 5]
MLLQNSPESEKPVAGDAPDSIGTLSETIDQPIDVVQIVALYLSILISWSKISIKFVFIRGCGHFINGLRCRLKLSRHEEYTPQGNEENSETIFKFHNVA